MTVMFGWGQCWIYICTYFGRRSNGCTPDTEASLHLAFTGNIITAELRGKNEHSRMDAAVATYDRTVKPRRLVTTSSSKLKVLADLSSSDRIFSDGHVTNSHHRFLTPPSLSHDSIISFTVIYQHYQNFEIINFRFEVTLTYDRRRPSTQSCRFEESH